MFKLFRNGSRRQEAPRRKRTVAFWIMGHMAKVDGRMSEVDFAQARFIMRTNGGLSAAGMRDAEDDFRAGMAENFDLEMVLDGTTPGDERHPALINFLCMYACNDGILAPEEQEIVERCCDLLEVPREVMYDTCMEMLERTSADAPGADKDDQDDGLILKARLVGMLLRGLPFIVAGQLARARGCESEAEIAEAYQTMHKIHYPAGADWEPAELYFKAGAKPGFDPLGALHMALPIVDMHEPLIRVWCQFACTGGGPSPEEQRILEDYCDHFSVPRDFMHEACAQYLED